MESRGNRRDQLIRICHNRLRKALTQVIGPGFKEAGDLLVAAAKHPEDPDLRTDALNGLSALETGRQAFQDALLRECGSLLQPPQAPTATGGADVGQGRLPTGEGLELLDEAGLECATAREAFVARCEAKCAQELYALSSRIGLIIGKRIPEPSRLPIGPAAISAALARAMVTLKLPTSTTPLFARGFCEAMLPDLLEYYYELNDGLAKAGILPNLKYKRINRDWADRARDQRKSSKERAQAFFTRASTQATDTTETVAEIRQLMQKVQPQPLGAPDGHRVGGDSVDRALSQLQSEVRQGRIVVPDGSLKQSIIETISNREFRGDGVQLDRVNSQTVEIMSELFEFVNRQRQLNKRLSQMVNRLQVPLYRVAVNNSEMLHSGAHSARRFLNVLADTGTHWSDNDKYDKRMIQQMERVVDRAVNEYHGDDEIFDELFEDLSTQIETADRRAQVLQRHSVQAAEGMERLKRARDRAKRFVNHVIDKYDLADQQVPRHFLERAWLDYLGLLLVRSNVQDSQDYKYACLAAQTVAYHNRDRLNGDQVNTLTSRRKSIERLVAKALTQIGWTKAERLAAWEGLATWMDTRLASREAALDLRIVLPEHGHFGEALRSQDFPLPHLSEEQRAVLAKLQTVPFGTWFEFLDESVLRKMAWYSTVSSHVLFVNNRGVREMESTLHDLAILVDASKAGIYHAPNKPLFDRALSAIRSSLMRLADGLGGPDLTPSPI